MHAEESDLRLQVAYKCLIIVKIILIKFFLHLFFSTPVLECSLLTGFPNCVGFVFVSFHLKF